MNLPPSIVACPHCGSHGLAGETYCQSCGKFLKHVSREEFNSLVKEVKELRNLLEKKDEN